MEFINLPQGGMSVFEYSLKFSKLSKYAASFVSDRRDEMNCSVIEVLNKSKEACHSAMVHQNMNIYLLMYHAQQVEEARAKRKSRDANWVRYFFGGSTKGSLEIQEKPRL